MRCQIRRGEIEAILQSTLGELLFGWCRRRRELFWRLRQGHTVATGRF